MTPQARNLAAVPEIVLPDHEEQRTPSLPADDGAVDLREWPIDTGAAALVPEHLCRRHRMLPLGFEGSRIIVAMCDPGNVLAMDDVRTITGYSVRPVLAHEDDLLEALNRLARAEASWAHLVAEAEEEEEPHETSSAAVTDDGPIIKLVNLVIGRAINSRASDIHLEPDQHQLRIRYRIDGVLHEVMRLPRAVQPGVTSRIKLMAEMDIAERRIPQDGRTAVAFGAEPVDLRVATLPTMFGEKVVIRILKKSNASLDLRELGFTPANLKRFSGSLRKTHGMILVTGPTGSGKTTTLYGALSALNDAGRNIITVEDPVEYALPGAYQVQVAPKAGLTFANALRAILRSDPDIVLVGEIRDHETARLAIDAALTGHLVLSSLHTNDAASALTRLTEMGIEPYLVASAVKTVVAQRLVRVLCDRCRETFEPDEDLLNELGLARDSKTEMTRPVGCANCSGTGYRGRTAVHEVLLVDHDIERLTVDRAPAERITSSARAAGMRPMWEDALVKVLLGTTSAEEALRAVGGPS